ncbi:GNAT family N-acetyltransferase [Inquilinus sp. Marseille-Q2685]|uniref:GNAT family N-acetyltransferase n=1 Tax=Inquilinus sp. Marseille-Q2685 TaxID=2866581 RepID=UPI001CE43F47|nr:GNAT family N-acetyltransferase [Inquilinus sp. Marseille-Q2685]
MTDDGVRIRPWRPEDRALGLALFDSNVPRFFAAQERQDFIDFLDALSGPYFVLQDAAGGAVGCGGYEAAEGDPSVAVLCWGMVRGDRHRTGLGTALLTERLARIAADPAFRSVAIETTQHSCGFFARHGFVQTRQVPDGFAPGMDLVEMTLDLDAYRQSRKG